MRPIPRGDHRPASYRAALGGSARFARLPADRNKIGLDIALEALRDALGRKLATVDEIVRAAQVCRIYSVMKPYLQAVLS